MAIDLKNVNISLNEFQRISSGWYNAGEVKLHDANTLDKMNNHVATWWYDNNDSISHEETVAIKDRDNLPLNFHWTTTVAVDGKVTTTPLVVEPPPQAQPVANP